MRAGWPDRPTASEQLRAAGARISRAPRPLATWPRACAAYAAYFTIGASAALLVLLGPRWCGRTSQAAAGSASTEPESLAERELRLWQEADPALERRLAQPEVSQKRRLAFAMMAYNEPGQPPGESLWGALAMARALQRVSEYPVVLLTNTTTFPDGTDLSPALRRLNVMVVPVYRTDVPEGGLMQVERWRIAYWKLQIWRLTAFERIIWLDSDAVVTRSIDWLFERSGMWAQRDDWFCNLNQTSVCSGIMLMRPRTEDYHGLLGYAERIGNSLTHGDQELIAKYFEHERGSPMQLLSDLEASFGQCLGMAPSAYLGSSGQPTVGSWSLPAFVHKSGGWGNTNENVYSNVCFQHNVSRQLFRLGSSMLNPCQYHPLGAYWRELFCEAADLVGFVTAEAANFCNDELYYSRFLGHISRADVIGQSMGNFTTEPAITQRLHNHWELRFRRHYCSNAKDILLGRLWFPSVDMCAVACSEKAGCVGFAYQGSDRCARTANMPGVCHLWGGACRPLFDGCWDSYVLYTSGKDHQVLQ